MIYENGAISKILTEEGYITLSGTTPTYHYYLKDHLGNNRVVLNQNGTTVEQVNHYYPFGGLFDQTSETVQAYKYNGKELDRTYGIDLYDYSARFMDGAVGRFTTMDPLSEKYYSVSPYLYCGGNPVNAIDPDGRYIWVYYRDGQGKTQRWKFNGSNQDEAPKNEFVNNFIMAYNYNIKNGGGDKLKAAAIATDYTLNLFKSDKDNSFATTFDDPRTEGTVFWNPSQGMETPNGTLSPATLLEHEMDHGVEWQTNTEMFRKAKSISDPHFKTIEEKRVITGSEYKTGVANGELKKNPKGKEKDYSSYRSHFESRKNQTFHIPVISPISNKKKQ